MASGHVNRTNRPNTWLHRPATRREDSPCQLGAVHTWHFSAVPTPLSDVGYPGHTGKHLIVLSFTGFDPDADMDHALQGWLDGRFKRSGLPRRVGCNEF